VKFGTMLRDWDSEIVMYIGLVGHNPLRWWGMHVAWEDGRDHDDSEDPPGFIWARRTQDIQKGGYEPIEEAP
jgi:hypothetical protein